MPQLVRSVVWERIDGPGSEYGSFWESEGGWELRGMVVAVEDGLPVRVRYGITVDREWHTRAVHVDVRAGGPEQVLHLRSDGHGEWWQGTHPLPRYIGLLDIDLGITPATNILPIRRHPLQPGEGFDVTALWVRFPALELEPLSQRYERIDDITYRYSSNAGAFTALLKVDDLGLVVDYERLWTRAAEK